MYFVCSLHRCMAVCVLYAAHSILQSVELVPLCKPPEVCKLWWWLCNNCYSSFFAQHCIPRQELASEPSHTMAAAFGALCRIIWLGSLAWESSNHLTIEFSTPSNVAPHALGFCFTDLIFVQSAQSVAVLSLQSSNGLTTADGWRELTEPSRQGSATSTSSGFFSENHGLANFIQTSSASALLSSDQHYDTSFTNFKCVPPPLA